MTKENKYCDDDSKTWIIICNGKESRPEFISAKNANRDVFPELNFKSEDKEFIVQFSNSTDLLACRDSGKEFDAHVTNLNRSKRIKAKVRHERT